MLLTVNSELGHELIAAHARKVRLIGESRKKDDRLDAQTLARLARIDPKFLCPVKMLAAYLAGKAWFADELVFPPEAGSPLNGSNAYHGTSFLR